MNDLQIHHCLVNEVESLKLEVESLRDELRKARNSKNEWYCKYRAIAGIKLTTADRIRIVVKKRKVDGFTGSKISQFKDISKMFNVDWGTVRKYWYEK